jgi:dihydroorotate dehydrogenase
LGAYERAMDFYRWVLPVLRRFETEQAHRFAIWGLGSGLASLFYKAAPDDPVLATTLWGKVFRNPVGLAAGFDKNAEVPDAALKLGFGFVEVGGVTPKPQPGNPQPRLFRLDADRAVINRMGFNNEGLEVVMGRLRARNRQLGPVAVNLGKNKDATDAAADYAALTEGLAPLADFLVLNVSSPNTPGLRALQHTEALIGIVRAAKAARARARVEPPPPLLLKIAPDLDSNELADIARVAVDEQLDGLVVSNTTVARPASLLSPLHAESGGLSGAPLLEPSTRVLRRMYELTGGALPLIGVGGIAGGADAYAKIRAGASLVQFYSAMVFEGPGLVGRVKRELAVLLKRDGFSSVAEAVGADHRQGAHGLGAKA